MKEKHLNGIEGIGLLLVLISVGFQLLELKSSAERTEIKNYNLHCKLDALWSVTSKQYATSHPEEGVFFAINFKSYVDNWKIYDQIEEESVYLVDEESTLNWLWGLSFILGSILLIVPKFIIKR